MTSPCASPDFSKIADDYLRVLEDPKRGSRLRRLGDYQRFCNDWDVLGFLTGLQDNYASNPDQLGLALWALSPLESRSKDSFAQCARRCGVSEKAWRKLTSTRSRVEAAKQIRRLVRRASSVPADNILESIFYWSDHRRRQWAVEWFEAGPSSDAADSAIEDTA